MGGRTSRSKGKRGERAAKLLLLDRDYEVFPRPRGEAGDDFTAIRDGKMYSVEVKHTKSLTAAMFAQCKRQADGKSRMLMWHATGADWPADMFLVFIWERGTELEVRAWRSK